MIEQTHLATKVQELLRSMIASHELRPGERLQVDALASRFGVSRTPVKDALNQLVSEGVIEIRPRRGTFVANHAADTLAELFLMRLMVETFAAARASSKITDEQLQSLRDLIAKMKRLTSGDTHKDYAAFLRLDHEFHAAVVRLLGSKLLTDLYSRINLNVTLARTYEHRRMTGAHETLREHDLILKALESRDPTRVVAAVSQHVEIRKERLTALLDRSGGDSGRNTSLSESSRGDSSPAARRRRAHRS